MRKFGFGIACCVLAAAMLGGCKTGECCSSGGECCKESAAVKTEASATPAADSKCASKCASKCSGEKKASCPAGATKNE